MSMMSRIVSQFGKPHGAGGHIAGWIMANRPSNRMRNSWTVDLLGIEPTHRVLEIGFGPGIALERALSKASDGEVAGIDHSDTMLRQATARNREAIDSGRLRLFTGAVEDWAEDLGIFDRVYSVNVVQFWQDPERVFSDLRTRMRPGGLVASTYQPRHRGAKAGDADRMAERIVAWMSAAGFEDVRVERLELRPIPAVCVIGRRPLAGA